MSSFTFCLGLDRVSFTVQAKWGEAIAQSPNPSQLAQQGKAIAYWRTALSAYQNLNNLANEAIVSEKLALAY